MTSCSGTVAYQVSPTSAGMSAGILGELGGVQNAGDSPIAVCWGTMPWPEQEVGSENLEPPQGTIWECSPCPCGSSHLLTCVLPPQRWGSSSVGPRRGSASAAPAWHSGVSATAPTTAGTAGTRTQLSAVSTPGPGRSPAGGLRVCLAGAKLCSGLAGIPPNPPHTRRAK